MTQQREARLEENRKRNAESRASETTQQREARLEENRKRNAESRAVETTQQLEARLEENRKRNAESRAAETTQQLEARLEENRKRNAESRAEETTQQLEARLEENRKRNAESRAEETTQQREIRMTSFGATVTVGETGFMPTFKVQGQIYHRAGSILPYPNENPKFLQIYFMGDEQIFKTALDRMPTDEYKVIIRADKRPVGEHERRFNAPTINEVAVVIVGNKYDRRDIIIHRRSEILQRISETHRSYDALQYPLIFWQGEDGYHLNIMQIDPSTGRTTNKKISAKDFYAYRIMIRLGLANHILECRQLFQQFIVDMYAKIESERLLYIRLNQKKLRVDNYIHLRDAVVNDGNVADIGQIVILPATFTGSPRHMHEYAQDAMTYVRTYGRPDLFITFTCNPAWSEIKEELLNGQASTDRHDLIARVFKQKLTKLMYLITKSEIYGEIRCWMYSIEWQKRGLPHAHILIWLKDKIRSNQIDSVISAELPNPEEDPILFEIITKNMIHGPCGPLNRNSPCMNEGQCTKKYPRELKQETQTGNDVYPLYKRRKPGEGGYSAVIKFKRNNQYRQIEVDNRWVVPYTPLLSKIFQAHINVEYCNSVKSIKYICKYVNKGSDMAVFGFAKDKTTIDEITQYQMGRYISSNEAVWRILNFSIHDRYPTVVHLSVHLENGQRVYFTENNAKERSMQPPNTTLTGFFLLCQQDSFARTLLYSEVPKYYTWNTCKKMFCKRKQGARVPGYNVYATEALGRVYTIHPNNAECYYLRLLLHTIRGPTSFISLKTVNGEVCQTYREACQKHGLLENNKHWETTLFEASLTCFPGQLRNLFAIIITTCGPSNPNSLWETYKESMSEDILREARRVNSIILNFTSEIFNQALILIEDKCISINEKNLHQLGVEAPMRSGYEGLNRDILREKNYNIDELEKFVENNKPLLVDDQRLAYNAILDKITNGKGGIFFIDAPGGTGKTFMINLLLAEIRKQNEIGLAVASSGIASTLLDGGRTAHSALKLPLNLANSETPICNISKSSGQAQVLKMCKVIVWDECTMAHKRAFEALDRTLQDIRGNKRLMGGAIVVLAGDFRQTLPVIPRSTPADELNACLKESYLWKHIQKMKLTTNMRVYIQGNSLGSFNHCERHGMQFYEQNSQSTRRTYDHNADMFLSEAREKLAMSAPVLAQAAASIRPVDTRSMLPSDEMAQRERNLEHSARHQQPC
ncbi:uncharacterized protein [Temnothorax nylanderi]|uniref:uncharacterized protein n=1 Tax=Temnothorax nylanderi TaxID=102681 RepID=UPI003A843065